MLLTFNPPYGIVFMGMNGMARSRLVTADLR